MLPEFLPAERPECEQFVGMFSELPSVCHSPFERLFSIPPVSYGVLSRIFVRLVNQPLTNCLLAWKEGIMIQRINPLGQKGGRRGRFRTCVSASAPVGTAAFWGSKASGRKKGSRVNHSPLGGSSLSREEVDYAIRDIVVVEYITSICKLKLTVVCIFCLVYFSIMTVFLTFCNIVFCLFAAPLPLFSNEGINISH